jgi:phage-related protein
MPTNIVDDFRSDILVRGPCAIVAYARRRNGKRPAKEYIENLEAPGQAKLTKSFRQMAEVGKIYNTERFRKLQDKIYEFKVLPKVRVLCFLWGQTWFLTHGYNKQTGKTPARQIERAKDIMKEHISLLS